jgi:hypothetical protein
MKDRTIKQVQYICVGYLWRGGMKEIKVKVYGGWISYTYMKWNKDSSCNCFKWVRERVKGERGWGDVINAQCKLNRNFHYESPPCIMNIS